MTKTAKEVFIKHALLSKIDGKTPDEKEINEALEHKDMKFVLDAMEEYATSKLSVQVKEEEILTDEFDQYLMENFDISFSVAVNKYVWSKTEGKTNKPYSLLEIYKLFLTEKGNK